ncbi:DnaA N-terminal domain-containing protein [Oceanobacillus sp. FSL K6-2867]|uniref:DnaA N-terminal domain-containing protein n=1 Tax=Oceanobacillus sp. FSL K6-2867 TaxID=2954748 RepID=UPI0030D9AA82
MGIWSEVLDIIKERISKPSFDTWFKKTSIEMKDDTITVYAPNEFGRDWIETQYNDLISEIVEAVTGKLYKFEYACIDKVTDLANSSWAETSFSKRERELEPFELWLEVLNRITNKVRLQSYDTWFSNTTIEVESETITVHAGTSFARKWLEHKAHTLISETVEEVTGKQYTIKFTSPPEVVKGEGDGFELWDKVISKLRKKILKLDVDAWFSNTMIQIENDTIQVITPNWATANKLAETYEELIAEVVNEITGKTYTFSYFDLQNKEEYTYTHLTYMNNNNSAHDPIVNKLQKRIEKLEARVRELEKSLMS